MTPADVEIVYEALAQKLDAVGPEKTELFLAKLVLLLANDSTDVSRVLELMDEAMKHLDAID